MQDFRFFNRYAVTGVVLFLVLSGCAGKGSDNPVSPSHGNGNESGFTNTQHRDIQSSNHYLWGYYLIFIDGKTLDHEIIPIRNVGIHFNVLEWLEKIPCMNCLKINNFSPGPDGTINFDVTIKHPFLNQNVTGFDVRGIAIFQGTSSLFGPELIMSDKTLGDAELVNADGYTKLYNIETEGDGPLGLQGYMKGKFSKGDPNALLNGFKRHNSGNPANTRNAFYVGDSVTVTYQIAKPTGDLIFGYAVDANWAQPIKKPVTNPMIDFGPDANCPEAWLIDVTETPVGDGLTNLGGQTILTIDVHDHQGKDEMHSMKIVCPEIFDSEIEPEWKSDDSGFTRYEAVIENSKLAPAGLYRCLISKEAAENDPGQEWLDLTAYQLYTLVVNKISMGGWARTWDWGNGDYEQKLRMVSDDSGNTYVFGDFGGTVDFDPGDGVDNHTSNGGQDFFLVKYNSSGIYQWAVTWGGSNDDWAVGIDIDDPDGIYVSGAFYGTVDFDPGSGEDYHDSGSGVYAFLSKFDSSGNFQWARTWGGGDWTSGNGIATDNSGGVYVIGDFLESADFDPGVGEDIRYTKGSGDSYLSKFDLSGNYKWVRTWGGKGPEAGSEVDTDDSGNIYTIGRFAETVDFDTGDGEDNHTSNGDWDVYLSVFNSLGDFLWARTWGGNEPDYGEDVRASGSNSIYAIGEFEDAVDFDTGNGVDNHTTNGNFDVFLSKFDSSGNFTWAKTWGGTSDDYGVCISGSDSMGIYVTGSFLDTVDFDPGPGIDNQTSNGIFDCFLSKFDTSGIVLWTNVWGGAGWDKGTGVSIDQAGNVYATGYFSDVVDFDPGPGEDNHATTESYFGIFLVKYLPDGGW